MIDILRSRLIPLILGLPVVVGMFVMSWMAAGTAAQAAWDGVTTAALEQDAMLDCDEATGRLFWRLRRFGNEDTRARLLRQPCGASPGEAAQ